MGLRTPDVPRVDKARRGQGKTVVWAHNSHVDDARQTSMSSRGEHNPGRLAAPRLEPAIGVVYRPETEMARHYFEARVAGQFDHVIHIDRSRAVEPLETRGWQGESEPPETYPVAL